MSSIPDHSNGLFINNGKTNKRVLESEIDEYLANGWKRGMKPRDKLNNEIANEKRKRSCLEKYGVENVHQLNDVKEKAKRTCLKIYGTDNPAKNKDVIAKAKQTNIEKWPDHSNFHNLKMARETLIKRYGSLDNFYQWRTENMDWNSTIEKQMETKKKNHSYNYSQPEENLYKNLCEQYGEDNVIRNYSEERYPFFCDFYIPSEDLFIELNRHWTHGGHSFDPTNPEDINTLEKWEAKSLHSDYMKYAIYNWTERDPLKLKTARDNHLNYKIIW